MEQEDFLQRRQCAIKACKAYALEGLKYRGFCQAHFLENFFRRKKDNDSTRFGEGLPEALFSSQTCDRIANGLLYLPIVEFSTLEGVLTHLCVPIVDAKSLPTWLVQMKAYQEAAADEMKLASRFSRPILDTSRLLVHFTNPTAREYWFKFAREEHCEENLLFWEATEKYKTVPLAHAAECANDIFSTFVKNGAEYEINVNLTERKQLSKAIENWQDNDRVLFASLQNLCWSQLLTGTFSNYCGSPLFQESVKAIKNAQILEARNARVQGQHLRAVTHSVPCTRLLSFLSFVFLTLFTPNTMNMECVCPNVPCPIFSVRVLFLSNILKSYFRPLLTHPDHRVAAISLKFFFRLLQLYNNWEPCLRFDELRIGGGSQLRHFAEISEIACQPATMCDEIFTVLLELLTGKINFPNLPSSWGRFTNECIKLGATLPALAFLSAHDQSEHVGIEVKDSLPRHISPRLSVDPSMPSKETEISKIKTPTTGENFFARSGRSLSAALSPKLPRAGLGSESPNSPSLQPQQLLPATFGINNVDEAEESEMERMIEERMKEFSEDSRSAVHKIRSLTISSETSTEESSIQLSRSNSQLESSGNGDDSTRRRERRASNLAHDLPPFATAIAKTHSLHERTTQEVPFSTLSAASKAAERRASQLEASFRSSSRQGYSPERKDNLRPLTPTSPFALPSPVLLTLTPSDSSVNDTEAHSETFLQPKLVSTSSTISIDGSLEGERDASRSSFSSLQITSRGAGNEQEKERDLIRAIVERNRLATQPPTMGRVISNESIRSSSDDEERKTNSNPHIEVDERSVRPDERSVRGDERSIRPPQIPQASPTSLELARAREHISAFKTLWTCTRCPPPPVIETPVRPKPSLYHTKLQNPLLLSVVFGALPSSAFSEQLLWMKQLYEITQTKETSGIEAVLMTDNWQLWIFDILSEVPSNHGKWFWTKEEAFSADCDDATGSACAELVSYTLSVFAQLLMHAFNHWSGSRFGYLCCATMTALRKYTGAWDSKTLFVGRRLLLHLVQRVSADVSRIKSDVMGKTWQNCIQLLGVVAHFVLFTPCDVSVSNSTSPSAKKEGLVNSTSSNNISSSSSGNSSGSCSPSGTTGNGLTNSPSSSNIELPDDVSPASRQHTFLPDLDSVLDYDSQNSGDNISWNNALDGDMTNELHIENGHLKDLALVREAGLLLKQMVENLPEIHTFTKTQQSGMKLTNRICEFFERLGGMMAESGHVFKASGEQETTLHTKLSEFLKENNMRKTLQGWNRVIANTEQILLQSPLLKVNKKGIGEDYFFQVSHKTLNFCEGLAFLPNHKTTTQIPSHLVSVYDPWVDGAQEGVNPGLPECKQGSSCPNKGAQHLQEFYHPQDLHFEIWTPTESFQVIPDSEHLRTEWVAVLSHLRVRPFAGGGLHNLSPFTPITVLMSAPAGATVLEQKPQRTTRANSVGFVKPALHRPRSDETPSPVAFLVPGGAARLWSFSEFAPVFHPKGPIVNCELCQVKFSLLKRKMHCHSCGGVFCATCLDKCILPNMSATEPKTVCLTCLPKLQKRAIPFSRG